MRHKARTVRRQMSSLRRHNPGLLAVLLYADDWCKARYDKDLMVTSVHREDSTVHSLWRGVDCRIELGRDEVNDITWAQAELLQDHLNKVFDYGRTGKGIPTKVLHLLDRDKPNQHMHFQVPGRAWRGTRA